jgi:hypothetical protein
MEELNFTRVPLLYYAYKLSLVYNYKIFLYSFLDTLSVKYIVTRVLFILYAFMRVLAMWWLFFFQHKVSKLVAFAVATPCRE